MEIKKVRKIKIEITRNAQNVVSLDNGGEWALSLKDVEVNVDFDGLLGVINEKQMTGLGLKTVIKSLVACITHTARDAAKRGYSEGEIIGDAIKMLEADIVDPTIGDAESSIEKK